MTMTTSDQPKVSARTSLAFARDQLAAIRDEQRRMAEDLDQAEADGRAAYEREDADAVRAAWDRRKAVTARRQELAAEAARVQQDATARLQPKAEAWKREAQALVASWRTAQEGAMARIEAAQRDIDAALDQVLVQFPAQRHEQAAAQRQALAALQKEAEGFPYAWPAPAFPEPELLVGPIRTRLVATAARLEALHRVQSADPSWKALGFVESPAAELERLTRR